MMRVKTFTQELKAFHTMRELEEIDRQVNAFLTGGGIKRVVGVCDTTTTGEGGQTIGLVRVVTYEE